MTKSDRLGKISKSLFDSGLYDQLIVKYLTVARDNPLSTIGQQIGTILFSPDTLEQIERMEYLKTSRDSDFIQFRIYKNLLPHQKEVFQQLIEAWNQRKTTKHCILGGRRSGKTELVKNMAKYMIMDYGKPKSMLYIGNEPDAVNTQIYQPLLSILNEEGIPYETNRESMVIQGGGIVKVRAATQWPRLEGLRGGNYDLIVIDEAAYNRWLKPLVETVLEPMLYDRRGSLVIQSSAPRIPGTYIERCYSGDLSTGYVQHHFDVRHNTYLGTPEEIQELLQQTLISHNWTEDHPVFQSEYLSNIVYDTEARIVSHYRVATPSELQELKNTISGIAIGVDYGQVDQDAMVSVAWSKSLAKAIIIKSWSDNKQSFDSFTAKAEEFYRDARSFAPSLDVSSIKFLADTNEERISFDLHSKLGLNFQNAYKYDKNLGLFQLGSWVNSERMLLLNDTDAGMKDLITDFEKTIRKRDENDRLLAELDDKLHHSDLTGAALLYASREIVYQLDRYTAEVVQNQYTKTKEEWATEIDWSKIGGSSG